MISNLLETKLHKPSPPSKRIQRTELIHSLTNQLEAGHFLTLVSAPAGFGKTALVSEWVSHLHRPAAWLSLDGTDNDPFQFFSYLTAALQKVNQSIGREVIGVLQSGQLPPLPAITASLVNDIVASGVHFLLVLDDFQSVQERAILDALEMILANPPEPLHLVLITRADPILPISRLRANNQMTEIRAADLRLSGREVDRFLNEIMGLSLSEADIAAMESRTEGWLAGLQLAAIAMHHRADPSSFIEHLSGSHRYILSYLTEEVLNRQSEEVQKFFLQTSILDKLCGELCDAVTGRGDSQAVLEKCFHANLFLVPLDDVGTWYRCHHFFRDLLRTRQNSFPTQVILDLHRRASRWFEEAGMVSESIEHALLAADYQHAVRLLENHALHMIMKGYLKTVEGWMQALPAERQFHNPRAKLAFAWMYLLRGNYEGVVPYLNQANQVIWGSSPGDETSKSLRAEALSLQATLLNVQGKPEQSIDFANQALEWAGANDTYVRSLAYSAIGVHHRIRGSYARSIEAFQMAIQNSRAGGHLVPEMLAVGGMAMMAIQHGQLRFAYEAGLQALAHMERKGAVYSPMAGAVYISLGLACYHWNQLDNAHEYLTKGIQLSTLSGHNASVVYGKIYLGRVFQAQGHSRDAARMLDEALDLLAQGIPAWLKPDFASHLAHFYLDQGNSTAAAAVMKQVGLTTSEGLSILERGALTGKIALPDGVTAILSLRLLLSQVRAGQRAGESTGELHSGIELASSLVSQTTPEQPVVILAPARLLRAQMFAIQGNLDASMADLRAAVELAEPEGYVRIFLDEGPAVEELLRLFLEQEPQRSERQETIVRQENFVRQVLAAFCPAGRASSPEMAAVGPGQPGPAQLLVEPLTGREMDVLALMERGLKYQEIAGHLFISVNTVRYYVKEIYSKLNVNNRTQAIDAAHKLNLL